MAADAVQLGPAVLLRTERREPLRPLVQDERHVGERLDVVHGRRAVVEPDHRGKRRLVARLGTLALERFEQRGLFARFVGAGAAVDVHLAVEARAEDVPAEEPARVRLVDRPLEHLLHMEELAADVDVRHPGADGITRNRAAFDEQVRIALHDQVVLERAGLAFIGVAGDVLRVGRLLVHELPFHAGREPGPAAAPQTRCFHDLDDLVGRHGERLPEALVPAVAKVEVEREGVWLADVRGDEWIHGQLFACPRSNVVVRGSPPERRRGPPRPGPGA
jgi:hypothetical protein